MELMGSNITDMFQHTFEEIRNGEFERKFEAERQAGYPQLKMAEAIGNDDNPQWQAERRLRELLGK
jgi:ketol-acid reductoisomerase